MADMRRLLRDLGDAGHTVVLSSHLMAEVEEVSDRVGVIRAGTLVAEGRVDDLRGRPWLRIRTDRLEETAALLGRLADVHGVRRHDGHLDVEVDAARAPDVTRALVAAGIGVLEIAPRTTSLEEVFLGLTHEEVA